MLHISVFWSNIIRKFISAEYNMCWCSALEWRSAGSPEADMNRDRTKFIRATTKICEGLLRLLEYRDLSDITIKELCGEAGVNRSTFYAHYKGIPDVLEEIRHGLLDSFVDEQTEKHSNDTGIAMDLIMPFLDNVRAHKVFFKVYMQTSDPMIYTDAMQGMLMRKKVEFNGEGTADDEMKYRYMARFFLSGLFSVIKEWVSGGCQESNEYVYDIIYEAIFGGGSVLAEQNLV